MEIFTSFLNLQAEKAKSSCLESATRSLEIDKSSFVNEIQATLRSEKMSIAKIRESVEVLRLEISRLRSLEVLNKQAKEADASEVIASCWFLKKLFYLLINYIRRKLMLVAISKKNWLASEKNAIDCAPEKSN